jgi:large subunit ribosomal protein L25
MSYRENLDVKKRASLGKSASKALRNDGMVPIVVYGGNQTPEHFSCSRKEITKMLNNPSYRTHIFALNNENKQIMTVVKDVSLHVVKDTVLHIDFMRVDENSRITIMIPIVYTNEDKSPGLKRGGVLNIIHHEIALVCSPFSVPENIEVSLSGLDLGSSLSKNTMNLPKDCQIAPSDHEPTLATIVAPSSSTETE